MKKKWLNSTGKFWSYVHLVLVIAWGLTIPAAFVFGWWESIAFVVFASIYANMATHWSAWQGARSERQGQEGTK